jgi:hypothetical protein
MGCKSMRPIREYFYYKSVPFSTIITIIIITYAVNNICTGTTRVKIMRMVVFDNLLNLQADFAVVCFDINKRR